MFREIYVRSTGTVHKKNNTSTSNTAFTMSDATAKPDIYGQVHPVETIELVVAKRKEFEEEVSKIADAQKKCLIQAQDKCPELLTDAFKLKFLRCEVFNADLAAKRYASYWEKRVEIFGPVKAFQALKLKEALCDDDVAMGIGFFNALAVKDPTGRAIIFGDPSKQDISKYTREGMCRAIWYTLHAALEEESAQKYGLIFLIFPHHAKLSQLDRKLMKIITGSLRECLPMRLAAVHVCHPPTFFAVLFPIIKVFFGARLRKRIQVHSGSEDKVMSQLESVGLGKDILPKELGGTVVVDPQAWILKRRESGL
jgi:hypothetical protein